MTATAPIQSAVRAKVVSSRLTVAGLLLFCGALCLLRWGKLDTFWGDSVRWMFEAYRAASGELPYRDFAQQYPPLPLMLSAATLLIFGAKFVVLQIVVDILSAMVVVLTWDTARRFLPGVLPVAVAVILACSGVANTSNFALFSLQIYSPSILLGAIGLLLVIREMADFLDCRYLTRRSLVWTVLGATIGLLSKPEFIVGILGCLGTVALLEIRLWRRDRVVFSGYRDLGRLLVTATAPAIIVYVLFAALCGPANVMAGIGGYGMGALTCPWWPTGLGLFGACVAVGYGVIAAAAYSLLHVRRFWIRYRWKNLLLWSGALLSAVAMILYLPYCVAELPLFSRGATPFRIASFYLSTGTVLLPVMWIGILVLAALSIAFLRWPEGAWRDRAPILLLLAPAFLISLRGLFGGTMSQLTQVSMAAYPLWFIVGPFLALWFLHAFGPNRDPAAAIVVAMFAYAALRLAGIVVTEARTPYAHLDTAAGTISLQDTQIGPKVYSYVLTHTDPAEPVLDLANGGGFNFAEHRVSPVFSTQFTGLAPHPKYLNADLARIEKQPPRLVIANDGPTFQATYGLCMNTGCVFPALVWRSTRLACDPSQTFPVLNYIRSHYEPAARFGEKVIYIRKAVSK
jgi:hypothetical protein